MSESERDFEEIINKLLIHIPEDNKLKQKLNKALYNYTILAPEIHKSIWIYTQQILYNYFEKKDILDLLEWEIKIINIWSGKEMS